MDFSISSALSCSMASVILNSQGGASLRMIYKVTGLIKPFEDIYHLTPTFH